MKKTIAFLAVVLLAVPLFAHAASVFGGENYSLPSDQTKEGNLYIGAGTAHIDGTVTGDLVIGGGTVTVAGTVKGDILAAGGTVTISGTPEGDVRIVAGNVDISAVVPGDVTIAGGDLGVFHGAVINGDLLLAGGNARIGGEVKGMIKAAAGRLMLTGPVGGDVEAYVGELVVESTASLAGNLTYTAERAATISSDATITGTTTFHQEIRHSYGYIGRVLPIVGWVSYLIGLLALTMVLVFMFPSFTRSVLTLGASQFWKQMLFGFLFFVATPVAIVLLFVSMVGWMLGIALIALFMLFLVVAGGYGALLLGAFLLRAIRKRQQESLWLVALVGTVALSLLNVVPILGWIVAFAFFFAGLGAFFMTDWAKMRSS